MADNHKFYFFASKVQNNREFCCSFIVSWHIEAVTIRITFMCMVMAPCLKV